MLEFEWIIILGTVVSVLSMFAIMYFIVKWQRKKLLALAESLGGELVGSRFGFGYCKLIIGGIEGRLELVPAGKHTPPRLNLSLMRPLDFTMKVQKTYFGSQTLDKLGLIHDIKIGEPTFDEKYVVKASDEFRALNFMTDANKRAAIEWLLAAGYEYVAGEKKRLVVSKPNYDKPDLAPERIRESFTRMSIFFG